MLVNNGNFSATTWRKLQFPYYLFWFRHQKYETGLEALVEVDSQTKEPYIYMDISAHSNRKGNKKKVLI